jgi:hypothetical protein
MEESHGSSFRALTGLSLMNKRSCGYSYAVVLTRIVGRGTMQVLLLAQRIGTLLGLRPAIAILNSS